MSKRPFAPSIDTIDWITIKHDDDAETVVESTRAALGYLRVLKRGGGIGIEIPEVVPVNLPALTPSEASNYSLNDGSAGITAEELEEREVRLPLVRATAFVSCSHAALAHTRCLRGVTHVVCGAGLCEAGAGQPYAFVRGGRG
jgi:hypothetical protein